NVYNMQAGVYEDELEMNEAVLYPEELLKGQYSNETRKVLARLDEERINYDLILALLEHLCLTDTSTRTDNAHNNDDDWENTMDVSTDQSKDQLLGDDDEDETVVALKEAVDKLDIKEGTKDDAILIFLPGMPEIRLLHQ